MFDDNALTKAGTAGKSVNGSKCDRKHGLMERLGQQGTEVECTEEESVDMLVCEGCSRGEGRVSRDVGTWCCRCGR